MYYLTVLEARCPKPRCWRGLFYPSRDSRANPFLNSSSFWGLQIFLGFLHSWLHFHSSLCLCLHIDFSVSLRKDICYIYAHPNNLRHKTLNLIVSAKTFFPNKVCSYVLGIRTWTDPLGSTIHLAAYTF